MEFYSEKLLLRLPLRPEIVPKKKFRNIPRSRVCCILFSPLFELHVIRALRRGKERENCEENPIHTVPWIRLWPSVFPIFSRNDSSGVLLFFPTIRLTLSPSVYPHEKGVLRIYNRNVLHAHFYIFLCVLPRPLQQDIVSRKLFNKVIFCEGGEKLISTQVSLVRPHK